MLFFPWLCAGRRNSRECSPMLQSFFRQKHNMPWTRVSSFRDACSMGVGIFLGVACTARVIYKDYSAALDALPQPLSWTALDAHDLQTYIRSQILRADKLRLTCTHAARTHDVTIESEEDIQRFAESIQIVGPPRLLFRHLVGYTVEVVYLTRVRPARC